MKLKSKILVIAGSDSSGGAGIQADIKTITSLGSYAMTAITAITSQNTSGVLSILKVPINEIKNQGRMLVRKSGTEPKIRIMGESENKMLISKCINIVKRSIK